MFILLFSLLFRWAPINLSCVWSSDILGDKNNFLPAFPVSPGQRPAYCLPWLRFHMIIHVCSRDWSCRNYEATKLRITALSLLLFIIFHYFYSQMAGRPGRVEGCLQVGWGREGGGGGGLCDGLWWPGLVRLSPRYRYYLFTPPSQHPACITGINITILLQSDTFQSNN